MKRTLIIYDIVAMQQVLNLLNNISLTGIENAKRIAAIEALLQSPLKMQNERSENGKNNQEECKSVSEKQITVK